MCDADTRDDLAGLASSGSHCWRQPVEVYPVDPEKGFGLSHLCPTLFFLSPCSSFRMPPSGIQPLLNALISILPLEPGVTAFEFSRSLAPSHRPGCLRTDQGLLLERFLACPGSVGLPAAALRSQLH